jgi:adenosylcobinamide-GDP ribazoletransferase
VATSFKHPDVVDVPGAAAAWLQDVRIAASFLTCLPVAPRREASPTLHADVGAPQDAMSAEIARACAAFPLVGAGIGIVASLALLAAFELGLHPLACALIALASAVILTGALHEDGLADFSDGLGAGRSREQRLQIMRDSRIGVLGTLAIVFGVGVRAAVLSGLSSPEVAVAGLIAAASMSRAVLPAVMHWQKPARADGLSNAFGKPSRGHVAAAVALGMALTFLCVGVLATIVVTLAVAVAAAAVAGLAQRMLGGHTGDVLGAVQVVAETLALIAVATLE